jgi:hypothetical protein
LWSLSDARAVIAAALLGLLSDSLMARHLGNDMLCFLAIAVCLQVVCPPKLLRHSALVIVLTLLTTVLVEFSATALRATLDHELSTPDFPAATNCLRWGLTALGDGLYTALLAILPLLVINLWQSRVLNQDSHPVGNRWHRLTS